VSYWAVVQTESQRERFVAGYLERVGFDTYLPQIKLRRVPEPRCYAPLFPTYVFVRIIDRWHAASRAIGVVRLIMAGEHPARLPEEVMEEIRSREGRDGYVKLAQRTLKAGARVRIISGQFQGHIGLYDGQSAKERERVLLDLLGRSVRVELSRNDKIEPLDVA
jgi:transcriptional antiterminator RfaH